jgi:chromosome segregation ATPase
MAIDKKTKMEDRDNITAQDLQVILDVNKKAIEINIEVEKQNEQVISILHSLKDDVKDIYLEYNNFKYSIQELGRFVEDIKKAKEDNRKNLEEIKNNLEALEKSILEIEKKSSEADKNFFRLVVILGSAGVGIIGTLIQALIK